MRYQSLLYRAPIRIKVYDFHRTGEKEQSCRVPFIDTRLTLLVIAGTPVHIRGPRKSSVPFRVQGCIAICMVRITSFFGLTAWAAKHGITPHDWLEEPANQSPGFTSFAVGLTLPTMMLAKEFCFIVRHVIPENVIGGPRQLMSQCMMGNRCIGFAELTIVKLTASRIKSTGLLCRFCIGPS